MEPQEPPQDKPPFFKSWKGLYWFVLGNLVFWIVLLTIFTIVFE